MYAFVPLTPELFSLVARVEIKPLTLAALLHLLQDHQHSAATYLLHKWWAIIICDFNYLSNQDRSEEYFYIAANTKYNHNYNQVQPGTTIITHLMCLRKSQVADWGTYHNNADTIKWHQQTLPFRQNIKIYQSCCEEQKTGKLQGKQQTYGCLLISFSLGVEEGTQYISQMFLLKAIHVVFFKKKQKQGDTCVLLKGTLTVKNHTWDITIAWCSSCTGPPTEADSITT